MSQIDIAVILSDTGQKFVTTELDGSLSLGLIGLIDAVSAGAGFNNSPHGPQIAFPSTNTKFGSSSDTPANYTTLSYPPFTKSAPGVISGLDSAPNYGTFGFDGTDLINLTWDPATGAMQGRVTTNPGAVNFSATGMTGLTITNQQRMSVGSVYPAWFTDTGSGTVLPGFMVSAVSLTDFSSWLLPIVNRGGNYFGASTTWVPDPGTVSPGTTISANNALAGLQLNLQADTSASPVLNIWKHIFNIAAGVLTVVTSLYSTQTVSSDCLSGLTASGSFFYTPLYLFGIDTAGNTGCWYARYQGDAYGKVAFTMPDASLGPSSDPTVAWVANNSSAFPNYPTVNRNGAFWWLRTPLIDGGFSIVTEPLTGELYTSSTDTPPVSDFSFTADATLHTVALIDTTRYTANVTAADGFSDTVSFSVSGLPPGVTFSFSPASVNGPGQTVLTISTAGRTPAAGYTPTITATSVSFVHSAAVALTVVAPPLQTLGQSGSPYRSWKTQEWQNYFDANDARVRSGSSTLEIQFLNALAAPLEESSRRVAREADRSFAGMPLNLDHRGVYYQLQLPQSVTLTPDADGVLQPPVIQGKVGSDWVTLRPYDDILPVPSRVEIDPERQVVPMQNRLLFSVTGDGATKILNPGLPFPARIHFHLKNLVILPSAIEILIEGETDPQTYWTGGIRRHELLQFGDAGYQPSGFAWAAVDSITVLGLPEGAVLEGAVFQSLFPHDVDDRLFVHPLFRDRTFPRHWSSRDRLLEESYVLNRFSGHADCETWSLPAPLNGLAVEPNTCGLFTVSGRTLSYTDRRSPMPDNLGNTGLIQEPLYGLSVSYDAGRQADRFTGLRYVVIEASPYAKAASLSEYRYIVQRPDGLLQVLTPDGSLATYSSYAGWRQGAPAKLSMPVPDPGTYLITLELLDQQGNITRDIAAYASLALAPLILIDLSPFVAEVDAVGFDSRGRFWVWTGAFLVPLRFIYDAFVFDPVSRNFYLTDSYPQVQIP